MDVEQNCFFFLSCSYKMKSVTSFNLSDDRTIFVPKWKINLWNVAMQLPSKYYGIFPSTSLMHSRITSNRIINFFLQMYYTNHIMDVKIGFILLFTNIKCILVCVQKILLYKWKSLQQKKNANVSFCFKTTQI